MARFKQLIQERLKHKLSDTELEIIPTGFQQIGDKAILTLSPELIEYTNDIAREILDLFNNVKGVYLKTGAVSGEFRTPQIEFILGENKPVIIHREHGILYKFDITKIMFAKGNINERLRISKLVQSDEIIFDLFAGIGYFSLLLGKTGKPKKIYAFELNPIAKFYLEENIKLNEINKDREIICPVLGDSKVEALKIPEKANRVIMGILPAPKEHIDTVFRIIDKEAMVHYEGLLKQNETPDDLFSDFEETNRIYNRKVELIKTNYVKSYGPKVYHVTLDLLIT
ncbi:MAG TPA: class I SAM-dependent methyltransferase family protein [Candidatus Deferrimicrobium sp.]|nr:class I SAM-dependent methyltransferase family protein [Candidatus Deferrimicrobium sp.]